MSVQSANALTARWASTLDDGPTVLSGAGVYPLLALLSRYAAGPARDELTAVVGDAVDVDLTRSPTTRVATGFWSRHDLPLTGRWLAEVPGSVRGLLTGDPSTDQPVLDAWAADRTGGLVPAMPVTVDPETLLVLASAVLVVTEWTEPFAEEYWRPRHGPWQDRELLGLWRHSHDLDALRVVDTQAGPVTMLTVRGVDDVDVLLALGAPGRGAAEVLPAAVTAFGSGPQLPVTDGPGVVEEYVQATDDRPELVVTTVAFTVDGAHDLLEEAALFGLDAARDTSDGHFPGISPRPLAVSQARQNATASFSATGFKAAAVTAFSGLAGAAMPTETARKRLLSFTLDRPFGFLAVHRPTGLVLVAGWVTEPQPHPPFDDDL